MADETTEILLKISADVGALRQIPASFDDIKKKIGSVIEVAASLAKAVTAAAESGNVVALASSIQNVAQQMVAATQRSNELQAAQVAAAQAAAKSDAQAAQAKQTARQASQGAAADAGKVAANERDAATAAKSLASEQEKVATNTERAARGSKSLLDSLKLGLGIDLVRRLNDGILGTVRAFQEAVGAGIRFNSVIETQSVAFETLLGSKERANERVAELFRFAARTPFEVGEVVRASRLLQALAGDSFAAGDTLRLVGDAAAGVGRNFEETAFWIGRVAAGLKDGIPIGEAVLRLTEMGLITGRARQRLAELSGQALTSSEVVTELAAIFGHTAGAMEKQSRTLDGMISTLKDTFNQLAGAATQPIFESFKNGLQSVLTLLGAIPTAAEKVVADLEDKVLRLQKAAQGAGVQSAPEVTRESEALLKKLEQRANELRILSSGRVLLDSRGEIREQVSGRDINAELAETERLISAIRLVLGQLGASDYLGTVANEAKGLRAEIAKLEAQQVATTTRIVRVTGSASRDPVQRVIEPLPIEAARERATRSLRDTGELSAADAGPLGPRSREVRERIEAEAKVLMEAARRALAEEIRASGRQDFEVIVTPVIDDAGTKRLEELRRKLTEFESSPAQAQSQNDANVARAAAVELADRLLAKEKETTEAYRQHAEGLDEREQRLRAELSTARQLADNEREQLALIDDARKREHASEILRQRFTTTEAVIKEGLLKIEKERAAVQAEFEKQRAEAEKKREEARELERARQELELARQLSAIAQSRAEIEASRLLTREEKQRAILPLLEAENRLLDEKIQKLDAILAAEPDPQRRLEFQRERDSTGEKITDNQTDIAELRPKSVRDENVDDLTDLVDSFGTKAQQISKLFTGPIRAAIGSVRSAFQGILGDTDYWTQKLGSIPGSIIGSITAAISDMFAAWIAGRVRQSALHMTLTAEEGAAETIAKTPGAILSSISSFGIAVVIGLAAIAGILGGFASGGLVTGPGFVKGPGGPTDDKIMARLSNGEFVVKQASVAQYGQPFIESLNAGRLDMSLLPPDVAQVMTQPAFAEGGPVGGRSSDAFDSRGGASEDAGINLHATFAVINSGHQLREFARKHGNKYAYDYARRRTRRV